MKAFRITILILAILVIGALAILLVAALKAPDRFIADYRNEIANLGKNKSVLMYPEDLLARKTSLDARLAMSEDDSIGLRINFQEKAAYLEIQGIVLHKSQIIKEKSSYFFRHLSPAEKYILFHKPLTIKTDESTIIKDRFIIKQAPKDTLEAQQQNDVVPDTTHTEPVMYRMYLDHGIRLQVIGQLADTIPQFWPRFRWEYNDRLRYLKELTRSVLQSTPPPYQPTISIVIDSREAESIYRAVPKKGKVILEL